MSAFASESRPSKIVPPLIKCSIMITNRNSINEQIIILLNILLEICPCEEKVIYILYKYIYIIILYTIHLQCYYYFYPISLWLWCIWTLDFHWRIFRRCWLIWLIWLI
jgi:hypothetical protein